MGVGVIMVEGDGGNRMGWCMFVEGMGYKVGIDRKING